MELVGTARNPVPGGAKVGMLKADDGVELRYAVWQATAPERKGTVCLFTGRAEFIEKYFETVTDLRRRGFAVAMMDWRGQGGSGRMLRNRRKGYVRSFKQYDADLARFMNQIVLPDCPAPFFGMAHSMGANMLLHASRTKMCWFDRIVLCAPMVDMSFERSPYECARHMASIMSFFGFGSLFVPGGSEEGSTSIPWEENPFTSDPVRYQRTWEVLRTEPGLGLGSPTLAWVAAASRSIRLINSLKFPPSIKVPMLIVAAGNDQVVSTISTESFAGKVKMCRLIVIAGARHEILQERDAFRDQLWAAFDAFVPGSKQPVAEEQLGI